MRRWYSLLDTLLLLAPFLLVFLQTQRCFWQLYFCDRVCCGNYQQCASGVPDNAVYRGGSSSGEICCNTSDNLSDLVADYSDGSGCCGSLSLCVVLWRKAPVDQQKVNLTESGCVAAVTMLVIWGMLNFFSCLRPCVHFILETSAQAYKDYGVAYCFAKLFVEYRD